VDVCFYMTRMILLYIFILYGCSDLIVFVQTAEVVVEPSETLDVYGKITFAGGPPQSIADGSWLTVTVEDSRAADAPSVSLGKCQKQIVAYDKDEGLGYHINGAVLPENQSGIVLSLNAIISIGEKRESIKEGDYLTMTMSTINTKTDEVETSGKHVVYKHDIEVEKYE